MVPFIRLNWAVETAVTRACLFEYIDAAGSVTTALYHVALKPKPMQYLLSLLLSGVSSFTIHELRFTSNLK